MEVEQRLARAILLFYGKIHPQSGQFNLPVTKKDMASLIGTTPETLSRRLVSFVTQNIISMNGRREIQILEHEKLKKLAGL
jgi:CRP-like cAMP-binding protein